MNFSRRAETGVALVVYQASARGVRVLYGMVDSIIRNALVLSSFRHTGRSQYRFIPIFPPGGGSSVTTALRRQLRRRLFYLAGHLSARLYRSMLRVPAGSLPEFFGRSFRRRIIPWSLVRIQPVPSSVALTKTRCRRRHALDGGRRRARQRWHHVNVLDAHRRKVGVP